MSYRLVNREFAVVSVLREQAVGDPAWRDLLFHALVGHNDLHSTILAR